jgi:CHAT domain-containing protein
LHLTGEEALTVRDVTALSHVGPLRLIVLSACESGSTEFYDVPDESIGFPAAFMAAGATTVLATQWKVDEVAAALLCDRFYRALLQDNMAALDALAAAQRWLRGASVPVIARAVEKMQQTNVAAPPGVRALLRDFLASIASERADQTPFSAAEHWGAFVLVGASPHEQ